MILLTILYVGLYVFAEGWEQGAEGAGVEGERAEKGRELGGSRETVPPVHPLREGVGEKTVVGENGWEKGWGGRNGMEMREKGMGNLDGRWERRGGSGTLPFIPLPSPYPFSHISLPFSPTAFSPISHSLLSHLLF